VNESGASAAPLTFFPATIWAVTKAAINGTEYFMMMAFFGDCDQSLIVSTKNERNFLALEADFYFRMPPFAEIAKSRIAAAHLSRYQTF
jgi:chloramphenicol O-acetyltransferase